MVGRGKERQRRGKSISLLVPTSSLRRCVKHVSCRLFPFLSVTSHSFMIIVNCVTGGVVVWGLEVTSFPTQAETCGWIWLSYGFARVSCVSVSCLVAFPSLCTLFVMWFVLYDVIIYVLNVWGMCVTVGWRVGWRLRVWGSALVCSVLSCFVLCCVCLGSTTLSSQTIFIYNKSV